MEKDAEFLSKTAMLDPSHARSKQTLFTRTATLFWIIKGFVAITIIEEKKDKAVPSSQQTTPALTLGKTLLRSSKPT